MLPGDQAALPLEVLELRQGEEEEFRASLRQLAALCRASGLGGGATGTSSRLRPHEVLTVALREYSQRRGIIDPVAASSVGCAAEGAAAEGGEAAAGVGRVEDPHAGAHCLICLALTRVVYVHHVRQLLRCTCLLHLRRGPASTSRASMVYPYAWKTKPCDIAASGYPRGGVSWRSKVWVRV